MLESKFTEERLAFALTQATGIVSDHITGHLRHRNSKRESPGSAGNFLD
jgi:hypothetical protein